MKQSPGSDGKTKVETVNEIVGVIVANIKYVIAFMFVCANQVKLQWNMAT